jgi:hypothetical protein
MDAVGPFLKSTNPYNPYRPQYMWIDRGLNRSGGFYNFAIEQQAARWGEKMVEIEDYDYGRKMSFNMWIKSGATMSGRSLQFFHFRFSTFQKE